MRLIYLLSIVSTVVTANGSGETNLNSCKLCHPAIYREFQNSIHKKATLKADKLHKALWDRYPDKSSYSCAKCHSPEDEEDENVKDINSHKGITCITCHTIKDIKNHPNANENIYETKAKTLYSAEEGMEDKKVKYKKESHFFGLFTKSVGSPYHDIDYRNEIFYNGKVCMGCHSHKKNKLGFELCRTDEKGAKDRKQNCITCHMPKVKGSATNIRISKEHAYHGFTGLFNNPKMLSKYIDMGFKKLDNSFIVSLENKAPHNILLHPLRRLVLKVIIKRGDMKIEHKKIFERVIGKDGKPTMPWLATETIKDTTLKANEKRDIKFNFPLKSGDEVEVILGYQIAKPKTLKALSIEDKELGELKTLKSLYFKVD